MKNEEEEEEEKERKDQAAREDDECQGEITDWIEDGKLCTNCAMTSCLCDMVKVEEKIRQINYH